MLEKNLSCEMRVIFAVLSLIFLLSLVFGKFFAIVGLLVTAFVSVSGVCLGAKIIGPIVCKKSVVDALGDLVGEVKNSASEAAEKAKEATSDVIDTVKDKTKRD